MGVNCKLPERISKEHKTTGRCTQEKRLKSENRLRLGTVMPQKKTNLNPKCATKYENAINGLPFAGFFPQYFRDSPRGRKCCHQWPLMSWQRRAGPWGLDKSRHAFSDPVPAFFVARVLFGCGGYPLLISHISHHVMKNGPFIDD